MANPTERSQVVTLYPALASAVKSRFDGNSLLSDVDAKSTPASAHIAFTVASAVHPTCAHVGGFVSLRCPPGHQSPSRLDRLQVVGRNGAP